MTEQSAPKSIDPKTLLASLREERDYLEVLLEHESAAPNIPAPWLQRRMTEIAAGEKQLEALIAKLEEAAKPLPNSGKERVELEPTLAEYRVRKLEVNCPTCKEGHFENSDPAFIQHIASFKPVDLDCPYCGQPMRLQRRLVELPSGVTVPHDALNRHARRALQKAPKGKRG